MKTDTEPQPTVETLTLVVWDLPSNLWYKPHISGQSNCWSLRCRHCPNYILDLRHGFNGLRQDNCKTRRETFKVWDLVRITLKVRRYFRKLQIIFALRIVSPLRWRHNDHTGVSNHQPRDCLLNRLFRRRSKKTSKLRVTGLCVGNSPGPVNSPHKGPVTRKMFPFDDVIMQYYMKAHVVEILPYGRQAPIDPVSLIPWCLGDAGSRWRLYLVTSRLDKHSQNNYVLNH